MILYLCRHATAEEPTAELADADRALTSEGLKKFRQAARGFLTLEPVVSHIFTSPLLRARQTAEILLDGFAHKKRSVELAITKSLSTAPSLKSFLAEIAKLKSPGVIAVGHEPTLSQWLGELCFASPGQTQFKKGAIAAINLERRAGELLWLMQPAQLRGLSS